MGNFFFFFFFDKETALNDFAKGFNSFLQRKKLKSADIAKELNLKGSSISTWKNGRGFPEFQTLFKLFEMGMTLKEMFGERLAKVIEDNSGFSGRVSELEKVIEAQREKIEILERTLPHGERLKDPEFINGVKENLENLERIERLEKELNEIKAEISKK